MYIYMYIHFQLMETQHTSKIPRIPFKPSIQDVKHASFNFSERATATKTMDSGRNYFTS